MSNPRPAIPETIKREVRQRCGFGCVFCGLPVYHYDHMVEYSDVHEHSADNLTLLCAQHHDLKSRKQLPQALVTAQNSNPRNKQIGSTGPHELFYFGNSAQVVAGGNTVSIIGRSAAALRIDGHNLIDFELVDGNLLLNVHINDRSGVPMLTVERNELVHSTHLWDYEYVGTRLTIRERRGRIFLTIAFETNNHSVFIEKAFLSHNGVDVLMDHGGLYVLNNCTAISGSSFAELDAAISIGNDALSKGGTGIRIELDRGPYDFEAAMKWIREIKAKSSRARVSKIPSFYMETGGIPQWAISLAWMPYPWDRNSCP